MNVYSDCFFLALSLTDLQRGCKAVALIWLLNLDFHHRTHRPAASPALTYGGGLERGTGGHHSMSQRYSPTVELDMFNRRGLIGTGRSVLTSIIASLFYPLRS